MRIMSVVAIAVSAILLAPSDSEARSYRSSGRTYGFATSRCKTSSCVAKHPSGKWVHPLTARKHRR